MPCGADSARCHRPWAKTICAPQRNALPPKRRRCPSSTWRRKARAARDELDAENIGRRDQEQRDAEYLTITRRGDGMYDVSGRLRAESAMVLSTATDAIISPRRGGPRFVDKEKAAEQEKLAAEDDRTIGQMMVDALVDLVQVAVATPVQVPNSLAGGDTSRSTLCGTPKAVSGAGYFEGHPDAVSKRIIEPYLCNSETSVVGFEQGLPVDSSTDQRLFNRRQRRALAARWGGCAFTDCDRPPPWTEAHHTKPWATGHHKTETADGILLCAHHHRLLHNNGWRIVRDGNDYFLHAPDGRVTRLESKSPAYRQHQSIATGRLAGNPLRAPAALPG